MLKNAIEATERNGNVNIGCLNDEDTITFWVKNSAFIPRDSQLQIFNRSFSTKGLDRGLGTYSMKLLTEKYLKGKISFTSDKENGTIFRIQLTK
jgi:sensor histidine kinase regulating citrate/malate metabolism